jgi:hypothetical protein
MHMITTRLQESVWKKSNSKILFYLRYSYLVLGTETKQIPWFCLSHHIQYCHKPWIVCLSYHIWKCWDMPSTPGFLVSNPKNPQYWKKTLINPRYWENSDKSPVVDPNFFYPWFWPTQMARGSVGALRLAAARPRDQMNGVPLVTETCRAGI